MKIYIESVSRVHFKNKYRIRCWRKEKTGYSHADTLRDIRKVTAHFKETMLPYQMAKQLLEIKRMNAAEVVNTKGYGVVLYRNWP
jgi:hypothetical protein